MNDFCSFLDSMTGVINQAASSSSWCPCFHTCSTLVSTLWTSILLLISDSFVRAPEAGGRLYSCLLLTANTAGHQLFHPEQLACALIVGELLAYQSGAGGSTQAWRSDLSLLYKMINHPLAAFLDVCLVELYCPTYDSNLQSVIMLLLLLMLSGDQKFLIYN